MKEIDPSKAHRLFYPDVPAVLCASDRGRVSAMPVTSCVALSEVPPLVGISCDPRAFTFLLVVGSRRFSLCFLDRAYVSKMGFLATHSGRSGPDKLADAGLGHDRGIKLDVPVIRDSAAVLECSLTTRRRFGDHVLVVGKIESARAADDFHEYWRYDAYRPILYTGWQGGMTTYGPPTREP